MDLVRYNSILKLCQLYILHKAATKRRTKKRKCSVREIFKNRKAQGDYYNLVTEMRLSDPNKYFNYFRMTIHQFDELLRIVGPNIQKMYRTKEPLPPAERLAVTLRYLASGDNMTSMSYSYRIGKSTVSQVVLETSAAIWALLKDDYFLTPEENSWKDIGKDFKDIWQLPNCIGALDGKHITIQAPPLSGSNFYNYKNSFSIILLALCDARYRFSIVDIGAKGRQSDGGVLRNSEIGRRLIDHELNIPPPTSLEDYGDLLPHYIVGDEAFPLRENLMRPYPGKFLTQEKRIFNYRLSRGRRVSENAFGILVARWRIFRRPLTTSLNTAEAIVKATLCLHNYLMTKNDEAGALYCPTNFIDNENNTGNIVPGLWRKEVNNDKVATYCGRLGTNTYTHNAAVVRNKLALYFMTEGAVAFQWDK